MQRIRCHVLATVLFLCTTAAAAAQQFVTDDAAVLEQRACQLEAWHGRHASWVLPACHTLPGLELAAGVGFIAADNGRDRHFVLQGKYVPRHAEPAPLHIGIVGGAGLAPIAQLGGHGVSGAFAYVPATWSPHERLTVHANLGWAYERQHHGEGAARHIHHHHALTWALRADTRLPPTAGRATLIAELFGEDRVRPGYQVGVRTAVIPDRMGVDVSWGGHTARGVSGAGWIVGAAITPPPIF